MALHTWTLYLLAVLGLSLTPGPTWDHFAVNLKMPQFQDDRVRQAFQLALDYKAFSDPLGAGWLYGAPVHAFKQPSGAWAIGNSATTAPVDDTVGAANPAETAQWQAIREMIVWLEERFGWSKSDARLFLTLVGDLRPGQMQVPPSTMRLIVPKQHLPS